MKDINVLETEIILQIVQVIKYTTNYNETKLLLYLIRIY